VRRNENRIALRQSHPNQAKQDSVVLFNHPTVHKTTASNERSRMSSLVGEDLHVMRRPDENDTTDSVPSTIALHNDDATSQAPSSSRSALGIFLSALIAGNECSSAKSSFSAASSPLPVASISIVEDGAKAIQRCYSLSFRRASRNMHQQRRRRARTLDAKRISRWESYPQSHNQKKKSTSTVGSLPRRRRSPSPASYGPLECHYQTREVIHDALAITADIETLRPSDTTFTPCSTWLDIATLRPSDTTFTPCSTWLDVVAQHASFSPKPTPKSLKKIRPLVPAKTEGVSLTARRAAALSGAPRRPHRQASLTNVNLGNLSLSPKDDEEPISSGAEHGHASRHQHHRHDRQRQRRHSDPSTSAAVPAVRSGDAGDQRSNSVEPKAKAKHVDDNDGSEGSFQDASSAEWKQIGARSA
jgi:hypothetical protein